MWDIVKPCSVTDGVKYATGVYFIAFGGYYDIVVTAFVTSTKSYVQPCWYRDW